jgi:hypothetical protein
MGTSNKQDAPASFTIWAEPDEEATPDVKAPRPGMTITCRDLQRVGLTMTTSGTVSSVPGTVNLSQSPVRIPAHCAKR